MIRKIIYTVLFMIALISLSFAEISQVWRTGQTTTYSAGDDGSLQKGAAWPSPRFTVNGDGTVTDKLTGLIWSQNAGTPTVGACTGGALNWNQALSYVACLNGINYLGHNDWRMPNRKELMSFIDYSRANPALVSEATNTIYFYGISSVSHYWSGSPNTGWGTGGGTAWRLLTSNGMMSAYPMTQPVYTWIVRGTSSVSAGPTISLSPATYNFGLVPVGSISTPKEFQLSNAGTLDLVVSSISTTGPLFSVAPGGSTPCSSLTPTIAPGTNCSLIATFSSTAGGYRSGMMIITSNDPFTPTLIAPLSGSGSYVLSVLKTGTGAGTVSSSPAGISCGSDCTEAYAGGSSVVLTATASFGSVFSGWSGGGCSGTGTCTVALNADTEVTAAFTSAPQTYTLTVSTGTSSTTGSGTVTSVPAGISCPADCVEAYAPNTAVTLTATPDLSSVFTGWVISGGWSSLGGGTCPGTGSCTVSMTSDKTVLAQFARRFVVTSPNGGETMRKGSTFTITWTYDASAGSFVKIELLKGGVLNRTIASSAPIGSGGSGAYTWNIPKNQGTGSNFQIRITSTSNSAFTDTSDGNFSITK